MVYVKCRFCPIEDNLGFACEVWAIILDTERNLVTNIKCLIFGKNKIRLFFHLHLGITLCSQICSLSKTFKSSRMSLVEENYLGDAVVEYL